MRHHGAPWTYYRKAPARKTKTTDNKMISNNMQEDKPFDAAKIARIAQMLQESSLRNDQVLIGMEKDFTHIDEEVCAKILCEEGEKSLQNVRTRLDELSKQLAADKADKPVGDQV